MHGAHAVGLFQAVLIPSLDDARKSVALRDARNVHSLARREHVRFELRADRERLRVRHAHFFEHFVRLHARLLELPEFGLREGFLVRFDETEFERGISVVCHRLDLHYGAGAGFHYGDGNHCSVRRKELGHSDFASDDCFIHR